MSFDIFLSHSAQDRAAVEQVRAGLQTQGVNVYLAEHDVQAGHSVAEKVKAAIRRSSAVVVLVTPNSAASAYVNQEIGFAMGEHKLVVPLVEPGRPGGAPAMLAGIEYIAWDPAEPQAAISSLESYLAGRRRQQRDQELVIALLLLGALLLIYLGSSE